MVNVVNLAGTAQRQPLAAPVTPDQIARRRALAESILGRGLSTDPVYSVGEGLARMGHAALGGWMQHRADSTERDARAEASRRLAAAMGGAPGAMAPTNPAATAAAGPPQSTPAMVPQAPTGGRDSYFERVSASESGGNPTIRNGAGSGAAGLYQFMPATWAPYAERLGLPADPAAATPDQQRAVMEAFTADNEAIFRERMGRAPSDAERYLMHFQGPEGALAILQADPSTPLPEILAGLSGPDYAAAVMAQNPNLIIDGRPATAGEVVGLMQQAMGGAGSVEMGPTPGASAAAVPAAGRPASIDLAEAMTLLNDPYLSPAAGQMIGAMLAQQMTPQTPTPMTYRVGDQEVTALMYPDGRMVEIGSGAAWQPRAPQQPTSPWRVDSDAGLMYNQETGETRPLEGAGGGGFSGTGMDQQAWGYLSAGNAASPEYAAAWAHLTTPDVRPDGSVRQPVNPETWGFAPPTFAAGEQNAAPNSAAEQFPPEPVIPPALNATPQMSPTARPEEGPAPAPAAAAPAAPPSGPPAASIPLPPRPSPPIAAPVAADPQQPGWTASRDTPYRPWRPDDIARRTTQLPGGGTVQESEEAFRNRISELQTTYQMLGNVAAVINFPNREDFTGWGDVLTDISPEGGLPSSDRREFSRRVDQLRSEAFLQAYEQLRGGGAITEAEGARAEQAFSRIYDPGVSDEAYEEALRDLEGVLLSAWQRLGGPAINPVPRLGASGYPTWDGREVPNVNDRVDIRGGAYRFDGAHFIPIPSR